MPPALHTSAEPSTSHAPAVLPSRISVGCGGKAATGTGCIVTNFLLSGA